MGYECGLLLFRAMCWQRALQRKQFGLVQSTMYPVYFTAMVYSIGLALLGHLLAHRRSYILLSKLTHNELGAIEYIIGKGKDLPLLVDIPMASNFIEKRKKELSFYFLLSPQFPPLLLLGHKNTN
ncbi:hypothetical protein SADUNF_Sadunf19G0084300 [Salix dunnii]|uniref:TMEM205-like domain-containing protein n=1 Tax=Salix dunnii TaxID=1413687 RepID=A0A835J1T3_9ROSI|nr:hypothetical protein SADUNF_Sadunf19G0084300 [Salix dunnii]